MVYPISLTAKLTKEVEALAQRNGKRPEEIIQRAVQQFVQQETGNDLGQERGQRLHSRIKSRMRMKNPSLKRRMSRRAMIKQMERLSSKVANGLRFETWQEAQSFMRGEDRYDFVRQQYLSH